MSIPQRFVLAARRHRYPAAVALCLATMLAALPLRGEVDVANIDMLFLLDVFVAAVWLGRGPAVLAAFLGVGLFDFFFIPPYLSFAVSDAQYLITFAVMLSVGLVTSHLVSRLAERTEQARESERQTRLLHGLGQKLALALDIGEVADLARAFADEFALDCLLLTPTREGLRPLGGRTLSLLETGFAQSAYDRNAIVVADSLADVGAAIAFLPLSVSDRVLGVMAIGPQDRNADPVRELRPLLEAAAAQIALIVEHLAQADAVRKGELQASEERLRSSILASLSHDMRTPLTHLIGLADTLTQEPLPAGQVVAETAAEIRDRALAMHRMLSNLLEMARLKSDNVRLNKEWQPIDEVIGSSARLLAGALAGHALEIRIPRGLPLVCIDAVLMERVICNLLENAIKYSFADSPIRIEADVAGDHLTVAVINLGVGFPAQTIDAMFELFVRGDTDVAVGGSGIGLAICKAIIAAHGGTIAARNPLGGACVCFHLPLGMPPPLVEERET
jgi:two-component system sensor histidine kinase KdpD